MSKFYLEKFRLNFIFYYIINCRKMLNLILKNFYFFHSFKRLFFYIFKKKKYSFLKRKKKIISKFII
jgi:hypothetical protein